MFFLRYRSIASEKEAQFDLVKKEQEILQLIVKNEKQTVQALSLELMVKKDFATSLKDKLGEIDTISDSDLKNVELFIQNELDLKSTRAELQVQMGDLSSEFYNEMKVKHPVLTEMDLKLAAMVVMNMSNKDISISKNITSASVRIAKNRLKKKLNLSEEDNLTEYLKELL